MKIGEAPLKYEVSPGKHAVVVTPAKGAEQKYALEVKPGMPYRLAEVATPPKAAESKSALTLASDAQNAYARKQFQDALALARRAVAASKTEEDTNRASLVEAVALCKLGDAKGSKAAAKRITNDNMLDFIGRECGKP